MSDEGNAIVAGSLKGHLYDSKRTKHAQWRWQGVGALRKADAVTTVRTAEPGTVLVIQVKVEEGDQGLLYATSPNLQGLFVAAASMDELYEEIPRVIKILVEEQSGRSVDVLPASQTREPARIPDMWAAVPPHVAAQALSNNGGRSRPQ